MLSDTGERFKVNSGLLNEIEFCVSNALEEQNKILEETSSNIQAAKNDVNYTNENFAHIEILDCSEDSIGRLVCTIQPYKNNVQKKNMEKQEKHIIYRFKKKDAFEFISSQWNAHIIEAPFSHYDKNSPFVPVTLFGFISYTSLEKVMVTFPHESLYSCRKNYIAESTYRMVPSRPTGSFKVQFNLAKCLEEITNKTVHEKAYLFYCAYSDAIPRIDDRPLSEILSNFNDESNISYKKSLSDIKESTQPFVKWDQWIHEDLKTLQPYAEGADECQKKAICLALRSRDLCCIQGPPGTGKTTTLVHLIKILTKKKLTVLVSAFSNRAVDTIYEKLVKENIEAVNLKKKFNPSERLATSKILSKSKLVSKTNKNTLEINRLLEESFLQDCYVLCLTCSMSQLNFFTERFLKHKKKRKFDVVIVDEASQCGSLFTWGPALWGDRLILTGDHQQLGPSSFEEVCSLLSKSLFESCIDKKHIPSYMLRVQYRMHQDIMTWSSKTFYSSQLIANKCVQYRSLRNILNMKENVEPFSYNPLLWIDTSHHPDSIENHFPSRGLRCSYYNGYEATLLIEVLLKFKQCLLPPAMSKVGVITPFRGQIAFIHLYYENIPQLHNQFPVTSTVDYFQGSECDIVIVSLVRSNNDERVGFLNNLKRLNVAVTRAKRQLIIIGDSSTLNTNTSLQNLWLTVNHLGDVIRSSVIAKSCSKSAVQKYGQWITDKE
ncbi:uncharacterized protein LOC128883415 isoform X2 [Hylaeus volcanicus]|uniref:uncharacterized protein LOC128883415 isoform X2 n=1 Tax=Hylaeus volcanicus TaxID=313075 RepID=UPI0023B7F617|nr:uncharacterized protein LOC128883415 isoform X2 [Hylaeus volcanicus]